MDFLTILLYLSPVVLLLYFYINKKYSYWSNQGIHGPPNIFPFGYLFARMTRPPIEFELDYFQKYGKFYGVYNGLNPTLCISNTDDIKTVLVKDFHLFINRRKFNISDRHWKHNIFTNHDEDWKRIRSITTPAFTSGKLRRMYPLLKQATDKLENYFSSVTSNGPKSVEIKSIVTGYTMDVIASTSFGTDTDSNGDRSKFNQFLHYGQDFFQNASVPKTLAIFTMPQMVLDVLRITHPFQNASFDFFVRVVKHMIQRSERRNDLITILKEAHLSEEELKNENYNKLTATSGQDLETETESEYQATKSSSKEKTLTEDEIIAQCILFFVAGFETTGSILTSALYHLSKDSPIQERLHVELRAMLADKDQNNLDEYYEAMMRLPYLEAVLKEIFRMYPPVARLERRLNSDSYQLGRARLQRGHLVEISTLAVHYDPELHPEPYKFDPDRFMPENKHKLHSMSYIPFGDGPRNCVGMRFAYQEAKICLASILLKFRFEANNKTPAKLVFPTTTAVMAPLPFEISVCAR